MKEKTYWEHKMKINKTFLLHSGLIFTIFVLFSMPIFAQAEKSNQPHTKQISSVAISNDAFFTGSDDGSIIKWSDDGTGEHYQVSELGIKLMALNPNGYEIAIYETDGFAVHRISVWNWKTKSRKFAKRFTDSITFLSYTQNGTYLMAGTTSVDGLLFLNVQNGTPLSVIKESTGIVSAAKSGNTKLVTYDQQGFIKYYSITDGNKITQFQCEPNLNDTSFVHRNGRYLVGTKNNSIYIVDATDGKTKNIILSDKPVIISSDDGNFYYIENDKENYCSSIKTVELSKSENQFEETLVKQFDFPENASNFSGENINKSIIVDQIAYFMMNNGSIFSSGVEFSDQVITSFMFTEQSDFQIADIEIVDDIFFILVNGKLLKGTIMSENTESVNAVDATNITVTKNKELILWTKNEDLPIYLFKDGQIQELFTPELPVNSLNVSAKSSTDNKIIVTMGNQTVSIYDLDTKDYDTLYSGTGLQDAILIEDTIYASKTALTAPNSALISINVETKETVPLPVSGQVIFNLTQRKSNGVSFIYGISNGIKEDGKKLTEIFSFNTDTKKYTPQLQWADEDTVAFLRFINGILYTNIGKSNARALDLASKKTSQLKRAASLPKKITGNKNYLVTLNQNGSITWYETGTNNRLETWHYSSENYLVER